MFVFILRASLCVVAGKRRVQLRPAAAAQDGSCLNIVLWTHLDFWRSHTAHRSIRLDYKKYVDANVYYNNVNGTR